MDVLCKICQKQYNYGQFILKPNEIVTFPITENEILPSSQIVRKRRVKIHVNGILLHYLIQEFHISKSYRTHTINLYVTNNIAAVKYELKPCKEIIDYHWNVRIDYLVRERCELEHTLSWLSTLGGAFSALGDYFDHCAQVAGKISMNQLKLALRLKDPSIVARCRLFLSLSLIQQNRFKIAKLIIYNEYIHAKNSVVLDVRLINMCKGIWCKLQYEYLLYKNCKKNLNIL